MTDALPPSPDLRRVQEWLETKMKIQVYGRKPVLLNAHPDVLIPCREEAPNHGRAHRDSEPPPPVVSAHGEVS